MKKPSSFFPFHNKAAVSIALTFMIMSILYGSWIARLPDMQQKLNLSEGQVGIALMGLAVGTLLATPLTVFVLKGVPTGKATFVSTCLVCFGFTLPALATGQWMLTLLLLVAGLFDGFMNISMNSAATVIEKRDQVNILSSCHGMFSVGIVIGAASAGWVSKMEFSFFWHIVMVAFLMLLLTILIFPWLQKIPNGAEEEGGFVFPPKAIIGLGIICMSFNIGEGAIADWSAIYLRDTIGSDPFIASLGLAIFSTGMAIGRFSGDKIRSLFLPKKILLTGGFVMIVGMLLVVNLPIEIMALGGFFLAGLGLSVSVPIIFSEATKVEGVQPSVGIASVATFSIVGFMCGPPLIGFIGEIFSLTVGFGFVTALAVFGVILIWILR